MNSHNQSSALRSLLARPVFVCLVLAVVTLAVFWPVRNFDFVNFDDNEYVTQNPHVLRGMTREDIGWAFRTSHASNWHPVTWLSHMIDADLFGADASGPHLVNLLLHAANALLLFLLLRRLTGAHWRSAVVAALFALHPLHVESVAWISERKDVLSAFFFLLTLWAYAKHLSVAGGPRPVVEARPSDIRHHASRFTLHVSRFYWLSLFFFALGLMSKPMLVTLPFVLLLLDYWPLQRVAGLRGRATGEGLPDNWRQGESPGMLAVEKIPFFIFSAISCVLTFYAQRRGGALRTLAHLPLGARLQNTVVAYALYLKKMIWPVHLAVPYPRPDHWPVSVVVLGVMMLFFLSIASITLARRRPWFFTGWFWFCGMLVPVIGLVQVGDQALADRYTYLPLIGLFIVIAWGANEWAGGARPQKAALAVGAALVLAACAIRTSGQLACWRNSGTLFAHSLAVTRDNGLAHDNLGLWLYQHGSTREALDQYRAALQINPDDSLAWDNLGFYEYNRGRLDDAVADYEKSLQYKPQNPIALNNLGSALIRGKKLPDAIQAFEAALRLRPDYVEAHVNFGAALADAGRISDAVSQYKTALYLDPNSVQAHNNLANALAGQGRLADAVNEYRAALAAQPDFIEAWHNLGVVLAAAGQTNDAVVCYKKILELRPDNLDAKRWLEKLGASPAGEKLPIPGSNFQGNSTAPRPIPDNQ